MSKICLCGRLLGDMSLAAYLLSDLATAVAAQSRVPLYERLANRLAEGIRKGVLKPGSALPPEPELARSLKVSRQTVHQALATLARRGLVTRRRGVGTFVTEPYVEQPLTELYSFVRTLLSQGRLPSSRLLGYRITVHPDASVLLEGRPDALVYELTRLRLVDGEPFVVETVYLPASCGTGLPLRRLEREPLYDLLRESCGLTVAYAEETLQPFALGSSEAVLLGLPAGSPAFLVERVGYAESTGRPVELRRSVIRGDRYRFRVRLEGPNIDPPIRPPQPDRRSGRAAARTKGGPAKC